MWLQAAQGVRGPGDEGANPGNTMAEAVMLEGWREHLAILAASAGSAPGDEALIVRMGDRLWQQRGLVRPHTCHLTPSLHLPCLCKSSRC